MRTFLFPLLITALTLAAAFYHAHWHGLLLCALLIAMEVSFSFDNAVVNAGVLKPMNAKWRERFLTWGMLIAVFGMYFLFPLVIVALAAGLGVGEVLVMAIRAPGEYHHHLMASHTKITAFGGFFLLMVFLTFIMNERKRRHWFEKIEENLAFLGKLEAVEILIALSSLLVMQSFLPQEERLPAVLAGCFGIVLYVGINSVTALFPATSESHAGGLAGFIYLNLLDASFSLDAVVGAFAICQDIVIIVLGLSAGALFVRSLTVWLVRQGTLDQYVYLEHGAHYAIGALAVLMLASLFVPVPETLTGLAGIALIASSFISSIRHNRKALERV